MSKRLQGHLTTSNEKTEFTAQNKNSLSYAVEAVGIACTAFAIRMSVGVSICLPFTLMSESHLYGSRYLNAFTAYSSAMFLSCEAKKTCTVLFVQ